MMPSRHHLAALIEAEILAASQTQANVAAMVGITPKHLSRVIRGHAGMSLDLVDEILAVLGRRLVLSTRVQPGSIKLAAAYRAKQDAQDRSGPTPPKGRQ